MSWEGISKYSALDIIITMLHILLYGIILLGFLIPLMLPDKSLTFYTFISYLSSLFIYLFIKGIKTHVLNFLVKSWLGGEIEMSKKDISRQLCFTLKNSNVDFFRLEAWRHRTTKLNGYVYDSPENPDRKGRMSCRFRGEKIKPILIFNSAILGGRASNGASGGWDPFLARALNSDKQSMELINRTRTRLNGLRVSFTTYHNPLIESKRGYAWEICAPVSPMLMNRSKDIEHVIKVIERIAYIIKTGIPSSASS